MTRWEKCKFSTDEIAQMLEKGTNFYVTLSGPKSPKLDPTDETGLKISVKWRDKVDYANISLITPVQSFLDKGSEDYTNVTRFFQEKKGDNWKKRVMRSEKETISAKKIITLMIFPSLSHEHYSFECSGEMMMMTGDNDDEKK
jgi:hypothetical protein